MISALINPNLISPLGSTLPSIFAKTSMVWSTILYLFSNKQVKDALFDRKSVQTKKTTKEDLDEDKHLECNQYNYKQIISSLNFLIIYIFFSKVEEINKS